MTLVLAAAHLNQSVCDRSLPNMSQAPCNTSIRPLTAAYKQPIVNEHEVSLGSVCVLVFLMYIN